MIFLHLIYHIITEKKWETYWHHDDFVTYKSYVHVKVDCSWQESAQTLDMLSMNIIKPIKNNRLKCMMVPNVILKNPIEELSVRKPMCATQYTKPNQIPRLL